MNNILPINPVILSIPRGREKGLTLIELMVTLMILGMLTTMTLRSTVALKQQARYDLTVEKLEQIRTAIIGEHHAVYAGQRLLSGYVVDNGTLPQNLSQLVDNDAPLTKQPIQPVYNGITLKPRHALRKGYHQPYLKARIGDDNDAYRDGFGNDSHHNNYGWTVSADNDGMSITSYGSDDKAGQTDPDDIYSKDISQSILKTDWTTDISGYSIKIRTDNKDFPLTRLKALLLVYKNGGTPEWNAHRTTDSACLIGEFDNDNPDCGTEKNLTFGTVSPVPIGQHLLVLVKSDDNSLYPDNRLAPNPTDPAAQKITLFPGAIPETLTFTLN